MHSILYTSSTPKSGKNQTNSHAGKKNEMFHKMKFNYNLITTTRLLLLTLYRNQLHNEVTSSIVSPHSGNTGFRKDRNLMEASERY